MQTNEFHPLISIIMPAFNSAQYIEASIQSVLHQTYPNWELIIIDDRSTDSTAEIVKKLQERSNERIRLLTNPQNSGVAYSRNQGIQAAQGEYIAFLDSDDLWTEDKLEKQIQLLQKKKAEDISCPLLFTGSEFLDEDGNTLPYILQVPEQLSLRDILKQNLISCSSVLADRALLLRHPMPSTAQPIHEDFAVWIQILKDTPYAYAVNEALLQYRVSTHSKSGNKVKAALMNWNTYRYSGFNPLSSLYYMFHYTIRSLKKWKHLR